MAGTLTLVVSSTRKADARQCQDVVLKGTRVLRPGEKFDHWVAIPVTADSPVFFKSRESREGATVLLIFSENPEPSRLLGGEGGDLNPRNPSGFTPPPRLPLKP